LAMLRSSHARPCRDDRYWRIVLKKSAAQLFGMLQGIRRA
jgi:hypothetical protein